MSGGSVETFMFDGVEMHLYGPIIDYFLVICFYSIFQPFLGGSDSSNLIAGKIKFGKETLATLDGKWVGTVKVEMFVNFV